MTLSDRDCDVAIAGPDQNPQPRTRKNATQLLPALATQVAFPNLQFDRPVAMAYPDDGSNLLFVVEQHRPRSGRSPTSARQHKQLFLELPDPIHRGNEEGLLGLAFHPKYKENKQFFVYYSANDGGQRRSVVSRFRRRATIRRRPIPRASSGSGCRPKTPSRTTMAARSRSGRTAIFISRLGDSGAADDPMSTGQNPRIGSPRSCGSTSIIPSHGRAYGIPADNPARRDKRFAHWAPEVYCIGLRNVWKFSFDRKTGELWAGDVGQNLWEMVHRIENGGNYGWSIREGFHPFQPQRRQRPDPAAKIQPPIVEYPHAPTRDRHDSGLSITGGYVYRGKKIPELFGVYVYADFDSGRIWGLRYEDKQVARQWRADRHQAKPEAEDRVVR